eukprot:91619_1
MSFNTNGAVENGQLWQRFQLYEINDRIENLMQNLRDVGHEFGNQAADYTGTVKQIKGIVNDHSSKVKTITKKWESKLNSKTNENNKLKDEIKKLKAQQNNYNKLKILQKK